MLLGAALLRADGVELLNAQGANSMPRFDPKVAGNGNTAINAYFRIGVLYALSAAGAAAGGDVQVRSLSWR